MKERNWLYDFRPGKFVYDGVTCADRDALEAEIARKGHVLAVLNGKKLYHNPFINAVAWAPDAVMFQLWNVTANTLTYEIVEGDVSVRPWALEFEPSR